MNIEQQIRDLKTRLDLLETRELDMKGRRAINAGRALAASDLVTLGQTREYFESPEVARIVEQHVTTIAGGTFGIPVSLGDSNTQGASGLYADAQHIHASGLLTKGDLLGCSTQTTRFAVGTDGEPITALASATLGLSYTSPWKGAKVKTLANNTLTGLFEVALPTLTMCGGIIHYLVRCSDGTDLQSEAAEVAWSAVNKAGTISSQVVGVELLAAVQSSPSTLAVTWAVAAGVNKVTIQVNANSSLTPTTLDIRYFLHECSAQVVTFL